MVGSHLQFLYHLCFTQHRNGGLLQPRAAGFWYTDFSRGSFLPTQTLAAKLFRRVWVIWRQHPRAGAGAGGRRLLLEHILADMLQQHTVQ